MNIREFMSENGLENLYINTTNEFLVEYNTLGENSLYKITGFSGSTGSLIITQEKMYLFVDGRYHIQADLEVNHNEVQVIKLQSGFSLMEEYLKILKEGTNLGIFSKKVSVNQVREFAKHFKLTIIDNDPLDNEINENQFHNVELPKELTGLTTSQKGSKISELANLEDDEVILLTNLDDISYLFNLRNYSIPYSAKIKAKALIFKNEARLFMPDNFAELEKFLQETNFRVLIDKNSTNDYDANLAKKVYEYTNPIPKLRAHKTKEELEHMQQAFDKTDKVMSTLREYIYTTENISEYDVEQKLIQEFKNNGATGLSFKPIIAKDKNSALAHYSKSSKEEIITDGSLVLIDCGAYFEGGLATDITRVFVKGEPSQLHKKIYTTVLKAFIKGYSYFRNYNYSNISGYDIDKEVRDYLNNADTEGFVFNHGLGHGIGINVHEYPPSLSNGTLAKYPIEENLCFTIEPGLYKEDEFGVRLENSCYFKNGEIHSFVHMNYENKLINYDLLTEEEKTVLKEFEVK